MNAVILMAIVLCVFVMGYRFYGKFLVLAVFPPLDDAAVPARRHEDGHDYLPVGRWRLAGYHVAAGTGLLSITGAGIGAAWGWVPAFLWIVVGTLVAGGVYALAGLWASLREDGNSLAGVVFGAAGAWAGLPVFLLGTGLLVLVCTLTLVLLGQLLQTHPEAAWPFLALLLATGTARRAFSSDTVQRKLLWGAATGAILTAGIYLGQVLPLQVVGQLTLVTNDAVAVRLPGEAVWVAIALAAAFHSANAPAPAVATPRGTLVGMLIVLLMLLVACGLAFSSPVLVAPDFNNAEGLPSLFPLLFLVITAGSVSGVCALVATGPTMRQIERHADASTVAFSGVLLNGGLAVLILITLCAGFTEAAEWTSIYSALPATADVFTWIDLAITKAGRFVAALGIPMPTAVAIVAAVVASMALSMLEATLRTLSFGVEEFAEDFAVTRIRGRKQRARVATVGIAATAFLLLQFDLGLNHWLFLGLVNQLFAGCVMLLLGLVMLRNSRGAAFLLTPASFVLVCAFWGLFWLLPYWWNAGNRLVFALAVAAGVLASVSVIACLRAFVAARQQDPTAASSDTP